MLLCSLAGGLIFSLLVPRNVAQPFFSLLLVRFFPVLISLYGVCTRVADVALVALVQLVVDTRCLIIAQFPVVIFAATCFFVIGRKIENKRTFSCGWLKLALILACCLVARVLPSVCWGCLFAVGKHHYLGAWERKIGTPFSLMAFSVFFFFCSLTEKSKLTSFCYKWAKQFPRDVRMYCFLSHQQLLRSVTNAPTV